MKINRYNVIFKPEPEGGFTVIVPSLPGCVTYGKDLTEARTMVEDAIRAYIASLRKHNKLYPMLALNRLEVHQDQKLWL